MSVWRRISSAWDTTTALGRPCWWLKWAPANSASHRVRLITWATTSPGLPGSTWVTKGTRCIDSMASATPTTCRPASRSSAAWITCTVLPTTVAKLAASSSARRLVSRPSNRSEEHTSELQSLAYLVCRLLLEKKKKKKNENLNLCSQQLH